MTTPNDHLSEETQEERGAAGSRDTGSDLPSGGPVDRDSGTLGGDESPASHGGSDMPEGSTEFTNKPPTGTEPVLPPYEGRQTTAKSDTGRGDEGGARTGGAVKPVTDADYKGPARSDTPGGATTSPADEQPASQMPETDRADDAVGPGHSAGTDRGEDKR